MTYDPRRFWREKAGWFIRNLNVWMTKEKGLNQEMQFLFNEIRNSEVLSVLEVGSGSGVILENLLDCRPRLQLTGLDISRDILSFCRDNLNVQWKGINLVEGAAWSLPFRYGSFDLVFTRVCLMHVPSDRISDSIAELVRIGKKVLITETVGNFGVDFCFNHPYRKIIRDLGFRWELLDRRTIDNDMERIILRIVR